MHAVLLEDPDELFLARDGDGDDESVCVCACGGCGAGSGRRMIKNKNLRPHARRNSERLNTGLSYSRLDQKRKASTLRGLDWLLPGDYFAAYKGVGVVAYDGGGEIPCNFVAVQLHDGEIYVACEGVSADYRTASAPVEVRGADEAGRQVRAHDSPILLSRLSSHAEGRGLLIGFSKLDVRATSSPPHSVRYGMTNFRFFGTELR